MSIASANALIFDDFVLDLDASELRRGGQVLPLRPKTFAVLCHLAENQGKLVTKADLVAAVWSGTCVSETVLKVCIRELRNALGDDLQRPRYIQTAHRKGYRFLVPVAHLPEAGPTTDLMAPRELAVAFEQVARQIPRSLRLLADLMEQHARKDT